MRVKLSLGQTVNILSAYASQVRCEEEEKERCWGELDEELSLIPDREKLILGDDLNGQVETQNEAIEWIYGVWGIGERNQEGDRVLEFALSFDLVIWDKFFKKNDSQYSSYKGGGKESQIDFLYVESLI